MFEGRSEAFVAAEITRRTYDLSADAYADATEDYDRFPGLRMEVGNFEIMLATTKPVLDLGCGGGRDSRYLAGLGRQVVALDYSTPMLETAIWRSRPFSRISFVAGNMLALPFSEGQFAGIWASGSVLHLKSSQTHRALQEIFRSLEEGGVAAISMKAGTSEGWREGGTSEGKRWFTCFEPEKFVSLMTNAGFSETGFKYSGRERWYIASGRK